MLKNRGARVIQRVPALLHDQYASQFENGFNFVRFVFFVRGCKFGKKALGLDVTNDSLIDASCFLR